MEMSERARLCDESTPIFSDDEIRMTLLSLFGREKRLLGESSDPEPEAGGDGVRLDELLAFCWGGGAITNIPPGGGTGGGGV